MENSTLSDLQKVRELILPLCKVELGFRAPNTPEFAQYYSSFDDGEYILKQALTLLDSVIARVERYEEGWQLIETAPIHKTVLLWAKTLTFPVIGTVHDCGKYEGKVGSSAHAKGHDFTHWQQLPAAPEGEK